MGRWIIDYKQTLDGSYTLYSKKYNQCFHNISDGALSEAYLKYVIPTFDIYHSNTALNVLDICFGLGYNTFATIVYMLEHNIKTKINFYSPELDAELINSLQMFNYPKEFDKIKHIIDEVSAKQFYQDEQFSIHIAIGDARDYIKTLANIDVVYQDPFSSDVNLELWTKSYFAILKQTLSSRASVLTYSVASPVRLSMWENGLRIYQHIYNKKRKATIATTFELTDSKYKLIDMKHKINQNPYLKSL